MDESQEAFIEGRSIPHNILICEELIELYHMKTVSRKYIKKLDLKRPMSLSSETLVLGYGFPSNFVQGIMVYITSAMFSIRFNGETYQFFPHWISDGRVLGL